ncbi:signal peptidase I [Nocardioides sp. TRM66260-LWL]|uniref:signal peptidase I n=1 Tax=Nocardioides sp. TRM66260-LWL TaxID=2874478 RepID=UPI001CC3603E|nr:signal peptidase I [Nocardioides sp. TRM66260-LWL]MBZ5733801.1 signal peptidase I [Nocardioides sp. TRM66260-LWL]
MRGLSRTLGRLASALVVLVAVLVAALAIVAGVVPRLVGGGAYAVLTSSMAPGLPPGTLVVTRGVDPDDVGIGDVVTYQLVSGEPAVVTHRVVGLRTGADGALQYVTRGDANPVDDPAPVRAAQVRGTLWFAVPWVGRATVLLGPAARQDASRALAALLALVAARETIRAWRGRGSRPGSGSTSAATRRDGAARVGAHRG